MPWRNISMEEGRLQFILEALDLRSNQTFKDLCHKYSITPKTGYKWLRRYHALGQQGLIDLPRTPKTNPTKISQDIEKNILLFKDDNKRLGPKKIHAMMKKECQHIVIPCPSTIGNILKKHNLTNLRVYRKHVAKTNPLSACSEPNDTWMYDFKGWFKTGDGTICEPLTITDGFSRYLLKCKHMKRKGVENVWDEMKEVFLEYGLPTKIRSDNGFPFASIGVGRLSGLAIKLIKVGVIPEWIAPGKPQENGRHERFHLTLKNETASPPATTLSLQDEKFRQFKNYFNNIRPHEALGQITPSTVYTTSKRKWDGHLRSPEYQDCEEKRKVEKSGYISWKGSRFFISEALQGEYISIKEISVGIMGIHYGPILLGTIDLNKGFRKR